MELTGTIDLYRGITVDTHSLPDEPSVFREVLLRSLNAWRKADMKGVWLKLPLDKAALVPVAVELGGQYHHAQPDYVMVCFWLPDSPCTLPLYATRYVGVGGFVVDEQGRVLVVKERHGPAVGIWKIPGGLADPGEDLADTAVREVLEETGVRSEFVCVASFREHHGASFGMSDIYFVCVLRPLTSEIVVQASEIAEATWMPMEEFLTQPIYRSGVYKRLLTVAEAAYRQQYSGLTREMQPIGFRPGTNAVYHGARL